MFANSQLKKIKLPVCPAFNHKSKYPKYIQQKCLQKNVHCWGLLILLKTIKPSSFRELDKLLHIHKMEEYVVMYEVNKYF